APAVNRARDGGVHRRRDRRPALPARHAAPHRVGAWRAGPPRPGLRRHRLDPPGDAHLRAAGSRGLPVPRPRLRAGPGRPRGAGISLLLVLLGLILLAILRPSTIDTLAIIFGIVALIMLHEAGHYFTAKRAGMKVTEFFLGFGPRVWSFRRGETEYGVKAIPAGGYVRIVGMSNLEDIDPDEG